MAISNGSAILNADVDAIVTTALGQLQADNAQLPGGLELNLFFNNLVTGTDPTRSKATFVAPFDLYLETPAVQCANFTASSTVTVTVTGDGAVANFPVAATGTTGASPGTTKLGRRLLDNTKTKITKNSKFDNTSTVSQKLHVFPRGTTITVTATTTSTATPSTCQVTLVMREFLARE